MKNVRVKPYALKDRCIKCGMCKESCPVEAIILEPYPIIDYNKCIECYCCHEVCPEKAMELKESILLRILKAFAKRRG